MPATYRPEPTRSVGCVVAPHGGTRAPMLVGSRLAQRLDGSSTRGTVDVHDDRAMVEARLSRVVNEKIRPAMRSARVPLTVEAWDVPGEPVPVTDALAADYSPFAV